MWILLILASFGAKALEVFLSSFIARKREIAKTFRTLGIIGVLLFGPIGFLIPFMTNRYSMYPKGPVRDLKIIEAQLQSIEKKIAKMEKNGPGLLHYIGLVDYNNKLKELVDERDGLTIQKAAIYNPVLPNINKPFKKLTATEKTETLDVANKINAYHTQNLEKMNITPEEKEQRIKKIRKTYIDLCEKGNLEGHISKMKI